MNKIYQLSILIVIFFVLSTINRIQPTSTYNYTLLKESKAYAKYENGLIYIVDEKSKDKITLNKGDILVIDSRRKKDPNVVVMASYEIKDKNQRNTIINILQEYEKENPSRWQRTTESMRLEWFIHNMSCEYKYKSARACSVDFNNNDEKKYTNKLLRKLFGL